MHEHLLLSGHARHLEIELGSGKPQDWVAGPEIRQLAALLVRRLLGHWGRRGFTIHCINEVHQKRIILVKHAACLGLPIVAVNK